MSSSWLSREVFFSTSFIALLLLLALLKWRDLSTETVHRLVAVLAGSAGLLFIFSMSRLYMLPTVPVWNHPMTPVSFFVITFLLGALAVSSTAGFVAHRKRTSAPSGSPLRRDELLHLHRWTAALSLILVIANIFSQSFFLRHTDDEQVLFLPRLLFLLAAGLILSVRFALRSPKEKATPVHLAFLFVLFSESLGRVLFYAAYRNVGL